MKRSRFLLATVNVCDTAAHPDTIGIRASVPGTGQRGEREQVRFRVQYYSPDQGIWHNPTAGADSGWVRLGSARPRARQVGRLFTFMPSDDGRPYVLRGVVDYRWRLGGKTVVSLQQHTKHGHRGTKGSDPRGFSAGLCSLN